MSHDAASEQMLHQNCRFYEKDFPDADDLVIVNVREIAEMGAYVSLLEYDGRQGMILLSELSRRRIRSINKLIRVGRNEVCMVIRVDREKGYIDLSKRRVTAEDAVKAQDRYEKAKQIHTILRQVADKTKTPLLELYQKIIWPLYRTHGHAFDAIQQAVSEEDKVFAGLTGVSEEERTELMRLARRKMTLQPLKLRAELQLTCFTMAGIEGIRGALLAAEACSRPDLAVKASLVAAPIYVIQTQTVHKTAGLALLDEAIVAMEAEIKRHGGSLVVKVAPYVATQLDDKDARRQTEGESSDDDDEDEEEEEEAVLQRAQ